MARRTTASLTTLALALLAFVFLASQVALGGYLALVVDPAVTHWLAARRTDLLTSVLTLITQVHSTVGIDVMLVCAALAVGLTRKDWRQALWLVIAVESSMALNVALKTAFLRHRPDVDAPLVHLSTFSFPSGHALASTVLWVCIWSLLPSGPTKKAAAFVVGALVALVCLSRVYLGAHYVADVLAGVCEGLACAAAWSLVRSRLEPRLSSGENAVLARP